MKSEKILCISRPEEDHSIDRKYLTELFALWSTLSSHVEKTKAETRMEENKICFIGTYSD